MTALPHTCHADGCTTLVTPRLLMCKRCWSKVSRRTQAQVWAAYQACHRDVRTAAASQQNAYVEAALRARAEVREYRAPAEETAS